MANLEQKLTLDSRELLQNTRLKVTMSHWGQMKRRVILTAWLVRLAAKIGGFGGVDIEVEERELDDNNAEK